MGVDSWVVARADPRTVTTGVGHGWYFGSSSSGAGGDGRRRIQEISHWKVRWRTVFLPGAEKCCSLVNDGWYWPRNWLFRDFKFVIDGMAESRARMLQLFVGF